MRRKHIALLSLALPIGGAACTSIIGLPDVPGPGDGGGTGPLVDASSPPDATMPAPIDDGSSPVGDGGTPGMSDAPATVQAGDAGDAGGGCPAGETMCSTGCVNEQSDQQNCGGCALACPIACTQGRCIVALATNQNTGDGVLAVDLTNVYWNTYQSGSILSVPIAGGPVTPIATGQAFPVGIATNGTEVFWTDSNGASTGTTAVMSSIAPPLTPSAFALVTTGFMGGLPGPIAVYDDYVYFTEINGGSTSVLKAAADTQAPAILITPGTTEMFGVAVDQDSVYWTNYGDGTVQKTGHDGGTVSTIGKGISLPYGIAIDSNNAYVTSNGTILSMPLDGTGDQVTTLAHGSSSYVATDSQYVYWTNMCPDAGTCPTVQKVPVDGGATITIADGPGGEGIAVDQTSAYYTSDGGIVKVTPK
jgi:hypothetical protein